MTQFFLLPFLLLLTAETIPFTAAHLTYAPPPTTSSSSNYSFRDLHPSFPVIIIALIMSFFLTGFLIICIHQCNGDDVNSRRTSSPTIWRLPYGLEPSVIKSFPIFSYSEVKNRIINKGEGLIECAVCINDFVDGDKLRLLPKCNHVFHPYCIDNWLIYNSTCPICRTNQSNRSSKKDGKCNSRTVENLDDDGEICVLENQVSIMVDSVSGDHDSSELNRNPVRFVEKFPMLNSTGNSLTQVDLSSAADEIGIQVATPPP
ncbi:E3 ubiquitin-protein ligase ATL6-like [Impatiens glandulifera]|uniref:E3 ubiquitin-protein ligase ATL6-like n=1 Tax=Impatiens glandulifera TaxID=253017 RepID=UPI001FB07816|nr:E3 ubiquitin-protein ligase ATL6-like [Impatiens glandulifera]